MATTTHTLKFRADNREVKVMGQTIEKAFDPRSPRQFRRELGNLQRRLKDITAAQTTLVRELQKTEEGTARFKELEDQLGAVADQAKTVKGAIGGITSAFKDFNAEKRRGFGAGMAQGLGVAQYIPSEAGMGRRIAGATIGQGIRGAAGRVSTAVQAPLRNPGIGGLTTALGAIPIVGQMAAGAVQALSGMYQEAVAFHQSRVQNLQYMQGGAIAATGRARGAGLSGATAFAARAAGKLVGRGGRLTAAGRAMAKDAREEIEMGMQPIEWTMGGKKLDVPDTPYVARAKANMERLTTQYNISLKTARAGQGLGDIMEYAGLERPSWNVGGTKVKFRTEANVKKLYARAANKMLDDLGEEVVKKTAQEQRTKASRERARRFSAAFWRESVPLPGAGFGASMGYRGAETQAELGGFMQARGGEYTRRTRYQFRGALAAKRVFGVQSQTAGAFYRMGLPGGGGEGSIGLAKTLQMAFELGLRGSQIPEYLQSLVSLGQQAEKQGVKINERDFGRSASLMKAVGLRGPQIGRVTAGMQQAGMDLSQRGVSSPVDMIMMRAAGYDPSQGIEGYSAAMNKLAGGMDLGMLNSLMGMATQGARGGVGGAGKQTQILMMRRFFGRLKVPLGPGQASTMLDAYQQGKLGREHVMMMSKDIERGERAGAHPRMLAGARVGVGMVAGLTKTEANLEAQRIRAGGRFAGVMKNLNQTTINTANAVNNFNGELKTFSGWMSDLTKKLGELTKGGSEGVFELIKRKLLGDE